jgi:hypothetical protein
MSEETTMQLPIRRIAVRIEVGTHLLSASDDPVFLHLRGPLGREFRLKHKRGKSLRRSAKDEFVFGAPDDPQTNVAHAELNDPTSPPLDAAEITGILLRKGLDPIPNVRGVGEMDDRLELIEAEVEIQVEGRPRPIRHHRRGPVWLGLVCGLHFEIPLVDDGR